MLMHRHAAVALAFLATTSAFSLSCKSYENGRLCRRRHRQCASRAESGLCVGLDASVFLFLLYRLRGLFRISTSSLGPCRSDPVSEKDLVTVTSLWRSTVRETIILWRDSTRAAARRMGFFPAEPRSPFCKSRGRLGIRISSASFSSFCRRPSRIAHQHPYPPLS